MHLKEILMHQTLENGKNLILDTILASSTQIWAPKIEKMTKKPNLKKGLKN